MTNKTPAEIVIGLFGVRPLARALDLSPGTICHWRSNNDGGLIPSRHHAPLLALARKSRKKLTATMLCYGAAT